MDEQGLDQLEGTSVDLPHDQERDLLDNILENYNFICHPELRAKFKQQIRNYSLGIAVAKPWHSRSRLRITVKPLVEQSAMAGVLQKVLLVPTHSQVCAFSKKLQFGWLRLQFMAGYNWSRRRPTLDYRVTTKWSDGARIKRKERYQVADSMLLRCKWNMDLHLPDMEGHLGADDLDLEPVDVDFGRLDFEISQVDMVLSSPWCWRARPPLPLENSAAGSSSRGGNGAASGAAGQPQDALGARGGEASSSSSSSSSSAGPLGGGGGGSGAGAAGKDGVVAPRAWWRRLGRKGGKEAGEEGGGAAQVGRGVGTGGDQPQHAAGRAAALASVSAAPQQPGGKGKGGRAGEGEEVWAVGVDTANVKGRSGSEGAASAGLAGSAGQLAAPPAAPWDGNPFAQLLDALRAPK